MNALVDVLRTINLLFGAVLIGGMVLEYVVILPAQRRIPPADAARAFQLMSPRAWSYLPAVGAIGVIAAIVLVVLSNWHDTPTDVFWITIAGIVCFAPAVALNLGLYLRADRAARAWTPDDGDAAFTRMLERMAGLHTIRMVLFSAGYTCFVVAAVLE